MGRKHGESKIRRLSLYQKTAFLAIVAGLVPMFILTSFISKIMLTEYYTAMNEQYNKANSYVLSGIDTLLESYNTVLKLPYYYTMPGTGVTTSYSFDNFRIMVSGENYPEEEREKRRTNEMNIFLQYMASVDSNIYAMHFIGVDDSDNKLVFHYSPYSTYYRNSVDYERVVCYEDIDLTNNKLIVIPSHSYEYYANGPEKVVTLARNYFDLRGGVGSRIYVGTLFMDVDSETVSSIIKSSRFEKDELIYITDSDGCCIYTNDENNAGLNVGTLISNYESDNNKLVIKNSSDSYGIHVTVIMDTSDAFGNISKLQRLMYIILLGSITLILVGSLYFSRKMTSPIRKMMVEMEKIETGNFDIELEVNTNDEVGVLAERFNQMSEALKQYINQSYLSKIRQTEAELTALKSQIYPHFLYNTLEIIRMTALDEGNENVPEMIEALSEQIHYLIGPVEDRVPLEREISIVKKYVYLLNCRINGKIQLDVNAPHEKEIIVPRLILQPVVENAYVHGIKGKEGTGNIMIMVTTTEDILEISVMDNGAGMDKKTLEGIENLLMSDKPGIKNKDNWQSIGLKNVHDRIQYLYGEEYGIDITSTPDVGTIVKIVMPNK